MMLPPELAGSVYAAKWPYLTETQQTQLLAQAGYAAPAPSPVTSPLGGIYTDPAGTNSPIGWFGPQPVTSWVPPPPGNPPPVLTPETYQKPVPQQGDVYSPVNITPQGAGDFSMYPTGWGTPIQKPTPTPYGGEWVPPPQAQPPMFGPPETYQKPTGYGQPVLPPIAAPVINPSMPQPPKNLAEAVQTGGAVAQQTAGTGSVAGQAAGTGMANAASPSSGAFAGDAFMGLYSPNNNWRFINPQQLPQRSTLQAIRQQSPLVDLYSGLFSLGGQDPNNAWATFNDYLPRGNVPGLSSFR